MLVRHFVKRMFASEQEDGAALSVGLGVVLALIASPGALVSLFLMDKYSSLIQWFRGQLHFDPYRASISDEYFFVVLSMTVTGLVMVLRWNRLFPDRRDFANLAALPFPIRQVFLANFVALLGLGLLFGLDLNLFSSVIFPAVVTMRDGTFSAFFRIGISHLASVLSASLFSFFGVFFLVGLLTLLLPKSLFRPVSIAVRMLLVVVLLSEFFSNLFIQLLSGHVPHPGVYLRWLPSFWFLGVYENVAGLAGHGMAQLGHRALVALALEIVLGMGAYVLCYRRQFLRLAESLEVVGAANRRFRLPHPRWMEKLLFRSPFEHACISFAVKVLARSEQHLMFFGGYLGIGLVIIAQTAFDGFRHSANARLPDTDFLSVPLFIAFFVVTGLRFAFDIPAALNANWMFRVSTEDPNPLPQSVARRLLLLLTVPWEVLLAGVMTYRFGWSVALLHGATVIALTIVLIETVLLRFRKIPFTCATQPEARQLMMRLLGALLGVLMFVPLVSGIERWMLADPWRFVSLAILLLVVWYLLRRSQQEILTAEDVLTFEERPPAAFEVLKLT